MQKMKFIQTKKVVWNESIYRYERKQYRLYRLIKKIWQNFKIYINLISASFNYFSTFLL